jgi:aminoglycoside phosphotransferase (APT) family kinase protein
MGWRLGQRVATRAKERAQQSVVEGQLQQQALAEALAEQRAVSGIQECEAGVRGNEGRREGGWVDILRVPMQGQQA